MKIIITIICLEIFVSIQAWKLFHKGRSVGGNLGEPFENEKKKTEIVSTAWFTQRLDHFDPTDEYTWQQKYFLNDEFYDYLNAGPVFLYIGGEGAISDKWMTQGSWVDYAQKFGAFLFQLEHRYYGESHPTDTLSTANMRYLTSQQAIEDLATFINGMNIKHDFPKNTRWIIFGGSYAGSLAAWLRLKYPHLVHGVMSSSGPLLAQVDFPEYLRIVVESLRTHSDECVESIHRGFNQIQEFLDDPNYQENLNDLFTLCDLIQDSDPLSDIPNLFEAIADNFAGVVQYNGDNRNGSSMNITTVCDIMVDDSIETEIERLATVNNLLIDSVNGNCFDYKYDTMITAMANTNWDSPVAEGARQWTYQTCTEFGFYQTSSAEPHVFGDKFPINFFIQQCQDIYGTTFDEDFINSAIERTNLYYGALSINATNIVYVQGSIDPWHALGMLKANNYLSPTIFIEGAAHCANMYPKSDNDSPQLTQARVLIEELIGHWLNE